MILPACKFSSKPGTTWILHPLSPNTETRERDNKSETSFRSLFLSWLGIMLVGTYLLFAHGCHADVDDEPALLPDLSSQQQSTAAHH